MVLRLSLTLRVTLASYLGQLTSPALGLSSLVWETHELAQILVISSDIRRAY